MFKNAKPLETGLDNDHTIFKVRCQVYRFESPSEGQPKKYRPCGVGELKVNLTTKDEVTRARMVLHAEKTHRLVLNAPIFDKMEYAVQNEKFIRFFSMNLEATMMIHMLRFKTNADALETEKAIKLCLDRITPTPE